MLSKVRCDRRDQEDSSADPVLDKAGVHSNVGRYFSVPISCRLHFVESVLQGVLVVCPAASSVTVSFVIKRYLRFIMALRHIDQLIDFLLEHDIVISLFRRRSQVRIALEHFLDLPISQCKAGHFT